MQEECATLAGRIDVCADLDAILGAFAAEGLRAEVRESSHYLGSRYVRVERADAYASLEFCPDAVLVRGDAASQASLRTLAERMSGALGRAAIAHQLELYAGNLLVDTLDSRAASGVQVELRIDADLCGPISVGTVGVIQVLARHLWISLEQATALVDRAVYEGATLELGMSSRAAAEALEKALAELPAGSRVHFAIVG